MQYAFGEFLLDLARFELTQAGVPVAMEPQVFELLAYLVRNQDRVVGNDELLDAVWKRRAVSPSALTSRINAARHAVGDTGARQDLIKTVPRHGYRFTGQATPIVARVNPSGARQDLIKTVPRHGYRFTGQATPIVARVNPSGGAGPLHQEILYCTSGNAVRIAYARVGTGPPIVKTGNWLNHLEYDWDSPVWSHLLHWLATGRQLIRYDARGNGLSDWDVQDLTFDAFVRDLESVVDAAGLDRFVLFGASQGCAFSIAYAVKHPERVIKLVLYGGFARGRRVRGTPVDVEQAEALITLMRTGWGQQNPAFRQVFTSLFIPGATVAQMDWFNELQRKTTSPENAVRIRLVSDYLNVVDLLPRVTVPTLVLHCRDDAVQPFEEGRFIAANIPGARLVGLEGRNHLILATDPGWPRFQEEVGAFLAS